MREAVIIVAVTGAGEFGMKNFWKWMTCAVLVFVVTALAAAQEPLGDVARKERARPKPQAAKVVTDEDIPSATSAAPAGDASATDKKKTSDADKADGDKDADAKDKDSPQTAQEKIKEMEAWKSKIAAQEGKVQALDQAVTQIDRDYRLRMSAFYADLGLRLRDEAKWADEEKKYHEDIAAKEKERDAERTKLEDMKDAARRAGVHGID
jgi:hypothetical protein